VGLTRGQRSANMQGAFRLREEKKPQIEGRNIVLSMLVVGLIFIGVIAIGQFFKWYGHRR
jgi:hypothetical protein